MLINVLPKPPKFMALVASALALAVLAGVAAMLRELWLTPSEWALRQATSLERLSETIHRSIVNKSRTESINDHIHINKTSAQLGKYYREAARRYKEEQATWDDATWHGPFTSRLTEGQGVFVRWPAFARFAAREDPRRQEVLEDVPVGTSCVVLRDGAIDDDACEPDRMIELRIVNGASKGAVAHITRDRLRRKMDKRNN